MNELDWDTDKHGIEILVAICRECLTYADPEDAGTGCYGSCVTLWNKPRRMVKRWRYLNPEAMQLSRDEYGVEVWDGYDFRRPRIDSAAKGMAMEQEAERIQKTTEHMH